jgi:hypothetical protein
MRVLIVTAKRPTRAFFLAVLFAIPLSGIATTSVTVDSSPDRVASRSAIAIGTDGLPIIAYWDNANRNLRVAHCGNLACTSNSTLTTVDTASVGGHLSIAMGLDGLPVIAYQGEGQWKVLHCGNAKCNFNNSIVTVDDTIGVGRGPSIAIGSDGNPIISYVGTSPELTVAHCDSADCSTTVDITTNDPGNG